MHRVLVTAEEARLVLLSHNVDLAMGDPIGAVQDIAGMFAHHLAQAVSAECSCGGIAPQDGTSNNLACQACRVMHRLYGWRG